MALASTSMHMVESAPQNDCCQCLFFPRMSSSCLLHLQGALRDQQVGLVQAPLESLLLSRVLEHMRFCVHAVKVEPLSPSLWDS